MISDEARGIEEPQSLLHRLNAQEKLTETLTRYCTCFRSREPAPVVSPWHHAFQCCYRRMMEGHDLCSEPAEER